MEAPKPISGGKGVAPSPSRHQGDSTRFPPGAPALPLPLASAPAEPRKQALAVKVPTVESSEAPRKTRVPCVPGRPGFLKGHYP